MTNILTEIWNKLGFWGAWFLVGLIYTLINVLIRKIGRNDPHFDPAIVLMWMILAPLGLLALLIQQSIVLYKFLIKLYNK